MIELVDLKNWKKQKSILDELYTMYNISISSREWRKQVKNWNEKWGNGEVDYCVIHSSQLGFKATDDFNEAMIAINDFRSRRKNMYKRERAIINGFIKKRNYKFDLDTGGIK